MSNKGTNLIGSLQILQLLALYRRWLGVGVHWTSMCCDIDKLWHHDSRYSYCCPSCQISSSKGEEEPTDSKVSITLITGVFLLYHNKQR